jgi:hypothetical protein
MRVLAFALAALLVARARADEAAPERAPPAPPAPPAPSSAEAPPGPAPEPARLDGSAEATADTAAAARDAEVKERLAFIERRLDGEVASAEAWTWGWVTFNSVSGVIEVYRAVGTGNHAERVDEIVGAAKAVVGIAGRLSKQLHARHGASELRPYRQATAKERELKLEAAERFLKRNAHEANTAFTALPHALNLAINIVGAFVVWGVGNSPSTAWQSAGIGVAVGELAIWTQPRRAQKDLGAYQRQFAEEHARREPVTPPGLKLAVVPMPADPVSRANGASFELRF